MCFCVFDSEYFWYSTKIFSVPYMFLALSNEAKMLKISKTHTISIDCTGFYYYYYFTINRTNVYQRKSMKLRASYTQLRIFIEMPHTHSAPPLIVSFFFIMHRYFFEINFFYPTAHSNACLNKNGNVSMPKWIINISTISLTQCVIPAAHKTKVHNPEFSLFFFSFTSLKWE